MPGHYQIPILATLLGALSLWLMLPRGNARGRGAGAVLGIIALGLGASTLPSIGGWLADFVFVILAAVTVISAAATVTFRNPVYCAIWFGQTLLGTAGLFLFAGAQFLAAATVVVYAGAILVTFLFVLMLAQPEGRAAYDRVSWEAPLSAAAGIVMVGVLSITIGGVFKPVGIQGDGGRFRQNVVQSETAVGENDLHPLPITAPTEEALDAGVLAPRHVAALGEELFGRHLIAVEVTGTLLLVALIGAAAIIAYRGKEVLNK
jgi:NADH-quinone oxidoreductase subunit J